MPEFKDPLRYRLYKDHKKLYEDLVSFEGMLALAEIEALKTQNQQEI